VLEKNCGAAPKSSLRWSYERFDLRVDGISSNVGRNLRKKKSFPAIWIMPHTLEVDGVKEAQGWSAVLNLETRGIFMGK